MTDYDYSLKGFRQEFKKAGVFYTDTELATFMKSQFTEEVTEIYDPTCGNGGLLCVFGDDVKKFGQEINPEQLEVARERLVNFEGVAGDTLKCPAFQDRKFRFIIANPPFSIKWEPENDVRFDVAPCLAPPSKADYAFILHTLHYLAEDGQAVVLEFPGILYRGQREGKIRQWIVEQNWVEKVMHIAGNRFADTTIATTCIVFNKAKTTTDIEFVDTEKNLARVVTLEEVSRNGFNLAVNYYVQEEIQREKIDPIELELNAQENFLKMFRSVLTISQFSCRMEGLEFSEFVGKIQKILDEFKRDKLNLNSITQMGI